jgi:hypothetical protein
LVDPAGNHELAKKRLTVKFRGETKGNIQVILSLKCVCSFEGRDRDPKTTEWKIQSVDSETYNTPEFKNRRRSTRNKDHENWFDIDVGLVMHDLCIGSAIATPLLDEVKNLRLKYLNEKRGKKEVIPLNELFTQQSKILSFEKMDQPPTYKFGEKQVCSIMFDSEKNCYYGKTIRSVSEGKRYVYTEMLNEDWLLENFSEGFLTKLQEKTDKYLWIPVGTARPDCVYPFEYNMEYPQIVFPQGDRETCVTSSFASCLHYMHMESFASWVEDFGQKFIEDSSKDQSRFIQQLASSICGNIEAKEFNSRWQFKKLVPAGFDVLKAEKSNPMLLQLCGSDGGVGHAVTVYQGMIFDSNLKFAVDLNLDNLNFCCDAVYEGIMFGYQCIPIVRNDKPKSKNRRPKKKIEKSPDIQPAK